MNRKLEDFVEKNGFLANVTTITGEEYLGVESVNADGDSVVFYDLPENGKAIIIIPLHQIKKLVVFEKE